MSAKLSVLVLLSKTGDALPYERYEFVLEDEPIDLPNDEGRTLMPVCNFGPSDVEIFDGDGIFLGPLPARDIFMIPMGVVARARLAT